jgi:AcrR family transcriptional regulator
MSDPAKPPRKSDRTRAAILNAARAEFAERGYEAATVRAIAAAAGIDPAMVIRYFGSKEALFALSADFDVEAIALPDPSQGSAGERAVRVFLQMWEGEAANAALPILLRSAATNAAAEARLRELFEGRVARLIARVAGRSVPPECAGLIAAQMLGFAYCRYILHLAPVVALGEAEAVARLGATVQRYLDG